MSVLNAAECFADFIMSCQNFVNYTNILNHFFDSIKKCKYRLTVFPGSSDPFYTESLLNKMGHYFLDILQISKHCVYFIDMSVDDLTYYMSRK